ncbi:membrane stabilizing protein MspA, partial [Staphylococcus saprophyticus]|uniref:membrane stabilizing protein MspA n=1 Tax=Staphylococcus saprophyticus TaxID=29385 RepID=UPI0021B3CE61
MCYITIFTIHTIITPIFPIIMPFLLLFLLPITTLSFPPINSSLFIIFLLLLPNLQITPFKHTNKHQKPLQILNIITIILFIIYA